MTQHADPRATGHAGNESAAARPPTRHGPIAQLLIAWSPLSAVLAGYALTRWVSGPLGEGGGALRNRLGARLHVAGPSEADRRLFGEVPTVRLQQHLLGDSPGVHDALAALVYVTHFVALPLVTALVWFFARDRFRSWIAAVLTLTGLGYVGYVAYPAAPPWLASERGALGPVDRISHQGWDYLHLDWMGRLTTLGQDGSNPVAAMPSLHAGVALLIALFLWTAASATRRALLVGYAVSMAFTLVYTGEHYVVDVVVGWILAAVAAGVGLTVARLHHLRRLPSS